MLNKFYVTKICLFVIIIFKIVYCTIDMNLPELQYLANHLTPGECRKLVAAAHYKSYEAPNSLDQAERKISQDIPCLDLLIHWNSEPGEGKGNTHEALEHRLRQMDKIELANWLGKTVFHELGVELEESIKEGIGSLATKKIKTEQPSPTLVQINKHEDPTEWTPIDSILLALIVTASLTSIAIAGKFIYECVCKRYKTGRKSKNAQYYEIIENETSGSESEDKFDVRQHKNENSKLVQGNASKQN